MKFYPNLKQLFGWKDDAVPKAEDGSIKLSDDQKAVLMDALSNEEDFARYMAGANKDLEVLQAQANVDELKKQMKAALKDADLTTEQETALMKGEVEELVAEEEDLDISAEIQRLSAEIKAQKQTNKDLLAKVDLLSAKDEDEPKPIQMTNAKMPIKLSATHLFASNNSYDAFEGRPWNVLAKHKVQGDFKAAAETIESFKRTTELKPFVETLNTDLNNYYIQFPEMLERLKHDRFGLPQHWGKRTGVVDVIQHGGHRVGELTQARKPGWKPKGNVSIEVEQGKVYHIQVDTQMEFAKLMELVESWLNGILVNSSSMAYSQTSFVAWLINEYNNQRLEEDNQFLITGIYAEDPNFENNTHEGTVRVPAGAAEYRQNGLLWLNWFYKNVTKQVKPLAPTTELNEVNIVEYMKELISLLPPELQKVKMEWYMNWNLFVAYNERNSFSYANGNQHQIIYTKDQLQQLDYTKDFMTVKGFPNHKIYALPQMGDSKHIFGVLQGENIEIMENNPLEKAAWKIEMQKRDVYKFLDYKIGIRYHYVGTKGMDNNNPEKLMHQHVFMNNQEPFNTNKKGLVFDFKDGKAKLPYNRVYVDAGWSTDIESIFFRSGKRENEIAFPANMIVEITGNEGLAASKVVKKNAALNLDSDFDLKTPGTLTLLSLGDGNFKELARTTTAAVVAGTVVEFTGEVIDANEGEEFKFSGDAATTLSEIIGGVEGQIITITGGDAELTVDVVTPAEVLADGTASVQLIYNNGTWYKI